MADTKNAQGFQKPRPNMSNRVAFRAQIGKGRDYDLTDSDIDIARYVFQSADRILSGTDVEVKVHRNGGSLWHSNSSSYHGKHEHPTFGTDGMVIAMDAEDLLDLGVAKRLTAITAMKGGNWHELAHVMFTNFTCAAFLAEQASVNEAVKRFCPVGTPIISSKVLHVLWNMVEDARVERLFTGLYLSSVRCIRQMYSLLVSPRRVGFGTADPLAPLWDYLLAFRRPYLKPTYIDWLRARAEQAVGSALWAAHMPGVEAAFDAVLYDNNVSGFTLDMSLGRGFTGDERRWFLNIIDLAVKLRQMLQQSPNQQTNEMKELAEEHPMALDCTDEELHRNKDGEASGDDFKDRVKQRETPEMMKGRIEKTKEAEEGIKENAEAMVAIAAEGTQAEADSNSKGQGGDKDGDGGNDADGDAQDVDGDPQGAPGGQAGKGSSMDGREMMVTDAMQYLDEMAEGSSMDRQEMRNQMEAMRRSGIHVPKRAEGKISEQPVARPYLRASESLRVSIRKLRADTNPAWERYLDHGNLDPDRIPEFLAGDIDHDEMYMRFNPGLDRDSSVEGVVLVDMSGSMDGYKEDVLQASWAIKSGMGAAGLPCSVFTFASDSKMIYGRGDKATAKYRNNYHTGGTNPADALNMAYGLLASTKAKYRMLWVLTDGAWDEVPRCVDIVSDINKMRNSHTSLVLWGMRAGQSPTFQQYKFQTTVGIPSDGKAFERFIAKEVVEQIAAAIKRGRRG